MGDRLTIVVLLPAPIGDVSKLLQAVTEGWPKAKIDLTSDPNGWVIELPPEEDERKAF